MCINKCKVEWYKYLFFRDLFVFLVGQGKSYGLLLHEAKN